MVKTFTPVISANFLKMIEDSCVGKALIEITGFSAYKMLTSFRLNLPTLSNLTGWSVDCDASLNYNPHDVILFLKYAWLYSETETNEHIDNLIHAVAQDITGFEKSLLIEDGQKKLRQTCKELEVKLQKEKETSIRNSKSASQPRGCEEVNEYLEELVQKNPKKGPAELWKLIAKGRNGSDVFIEVGKINHDECGCTPFGKKAFYARIQKIKGKSKKNSS